MNYDSIVKRINKAIETASARLQNSSVHVVEFGADTSELSGLVLVLADKTKNATSNATSAKSSGQQANDLQK